MRCRTARQWMTITSADEPPPRTRRAFERHLEGCEGCRRERTAYAALDQALGLLPMEASVPIGLERAVARSVRGAADAPAAARGMSWWLGLPALAGAAVLALAVRGPVLRSDAPTVSPAGQAPMMAVMPAATPRPAPHAEQHARPRRLPATVPREPPPELAARPDLFVDLPILRNLERLEHFEAIQTTTLDEPGGERSNG